MLNLLNLDNVLNSNATLDLSNTDVLMVRAIVDGKELKDEIQTRAEQVTAQLNRDLMEEFGINAAQAYCMAGKFAHHVAENEMHLHE